MTGSSNKRFNAEALAWDSNPNVQSATNSALQAILDRFPQLTKHDHTKEQDGLEVLEMGCGTGLLSMAISSYVQSIVAADAASGMIDALQTKLASPEAPKNIYPLNILLEDPEDTRLPPAIKGGSTAIPRRKFNLILSHLVLHHIPDLKELLKTMLGCLKYGASICLTDFEDFGEGARKFHPESKMDGVERHDINRTLFKNLMEEVGFIDVKVEVGWVMKKDVEAFPGQWGKKKPKAEELEGGFARADFPFLVCLGRRHEL